MKNKENLKARNAFYILKMVTGTLMALAGFTIFVLSAMIGVIEQSTFNILLGIALVVTGLLIANSIKVIQFFHDMS